MHPSKASHVCSWLLFHLTDDIGDQLGQDCWRQCELLDTEDFRRICGENLARHVSNMDIAATRANHLANHKPSAIDDYLRIEVSYWLDRSEIELISSQVSSELGRRLRPLIIQLSNRFADGVIADIREKLYD